MKNHMRNKKENRRKKLQKERKKVLEVEVEVEWLLSENGSGKFLRDLGGCCLVVIAGYSKRMILRREWRLLA